MRRIGIIGGGRFGSTLALSLAQQGVDVLLMDRDREIVQRLSEGVGKAAQGDAADAAALAAAGFADCDIVVVCMGSNLEASILATMALKDLRVPRVVAKASSDTAGKVLERVGADQIVYPERDHAVRLARVLGARTVLDYVGVSNGSAIIEMEAPERFIGKPLSETRIRSVYGLTVLEIQKTRSLMNEGPQKVVAPSGDDVIISGDILVLFGPEEALRRFEKEMG
jgi:trk system potassium uptake protein TrkA